MSRLALEYFTYEVAFSSTPRPCIESGEVEAAVVGRAGEKLSLAHLSNLAQVVGHTLVHRVSQGLEMAAPQERLEGPVKHGRCAEYQEGQSRSWQGQVEGWWQKFIVPCHLE